MPLHTVVVAVVVAVVAVVAVVGDPNVVHTDRGVVHGAEWKGVRTWFGIPFAAPPVGELRWRAPQPATPWSSPRMCQIPLERACPQFLDFFGRSFGNEDCLYLDVYAPLSATPTSRLPVMVWLFGGGWTIGDKLEGGLYEAANMIDASGDGGAHVHVAMNYRLGALGFMALDALAREANGTTGSYGLQDQRAALEWVQRNVGAFGGDATRVTIFGESAGAFSVCYHLASPPSRPLFRAAIMESGSCDAGEFFRPLDLAVSWSTTVARALGCAQSDGAEQLRCLRALEYATTLHPVTPAAGDGAAFVPVLNPSMPWAAAIDGTAAGLQRTPIDALESGDWGRQPLIIGTNNDEGSMLAALFLISIFHIDPLTLSDTQLRTVLSHFWNTTSAARIVERYDSVVGSPFQRMADALTDEFFVCASRRAASAYAAANASAFLYHFTYVPDWIDDRLLGDYHTAELEFVYANAWPPILHHFNDKDHAMAGYFLRYWTAHARTMTPNGDAASANTSMPTWPRYTLGAREDLRLDLPPSVERDYDESVCAFWQNIYLREGGGRLRAEAAAAAAAASSSSSSSSSTSSSMMFSATTASADAPDIGATPEQRVDVADDATRARLATLMRALRSGTHPSQLQRRRRQRQRQRQRHQPRHRPRAPPASARSHRPIALRESDDDERV